MKREKSKVRIFLLYEQKFIKIVIFADETIAGE